MDFCEIMLLTGEQQRIKYCKVSCGKDGDCIRKEFSVKITKEITFFLFLFITIIGLILPDSLDL